jgi:hypothetical protein
VGVSAQPRLHKIDAEMQRWCAQLEEEVSTWPDVSSKAMFGMSAYYRSGIVFAAIPRTRAARTASSLLLKLPKSKTSRRAPRGIPGAGWITFELHDEEDITAALTELARAYENARAAR